MSHAAATPNCDNVPAEEEVGYLAGVRWDQAMKHFQGVYLRRGSSNCAIVPPMPLQGGDVLEISGEATADVVIGLSSYHYRRGSHPFEPRTPEQSRTLRILFASHRILREAFSQPPPTLAAAAYGRGPIDEGATESGNFAGPPLHACKFLPTALTYLITEPQRPLIVTWRAGTPPFTVRTSSVTQPLTVEYGNHVSIAAPRGQDTWTVTVTDGSGDSLTWRFDRRSSTARSTQAASLEQDAIRQLERLADVPTSLNADALASLYAAGKRSHLAGRMFLAATGTDTGLCAN